MKEIEVGPHLWPLVAEQMPESYIDAATAARVIRPGATGRWAYDLLVRAYVEWADLRDMSDRDIARRLSTTGVQRRVRPADVVRARRVDPLTELEDLGDFSKTNVVIFASRVVRLRDADTPLPVNFARWRQVTSAS